VVAVAGGDIIAIENFLGAGISVGEPDAITGEAIDTSDRRLVVALDARCVVGGHQIACDFGLPVNSDVAADENLEIDAQPFAIEVEQRAVMDQAFGVEACAAGDFAQHVCGAGFEQTSADAALHIAARLPFEDNDLDAGERQQARQHQTRRAATNDPDLSAHRIYLLLSLIRIV
jgi:hypothetical protein